MKRSFVAAFALVLVVGGIAVADEGAGVVNSVLFFDIRGNDPLAPAAIGDLMQPGAAAGSNTAGAAVLPFVNGQELLQSAQNMGSYGDGQVLRLSPVHTSGANEVSNGWPNHDRNGNSSNGGLNLYMLVNDDTGGTGDIISSIGVDFNVTSPATPRNTMTLSYAWNTAVFDGSNPGAATGASWTGAKAVQVPVTGSPTASYDTSTGLVPSATPYRVGTLTATAGVRNCTTGAGHQANSTYTIKMSVNNLLITRTFSSGADVDGHEDVALGYAVGLGAGGPGADLSSSPDHGAPPDTQGVNGSSQSATSDVDDGAVVVASKGDFNGNGTITNIDVTPFNTALGLAVPNTYKQSQSYFGDFNGDRRVTNIDVTAFNGMLATSPSCP